MKSDTEELCRLKFDEFLQASSESGLISWEGVNQQDEPPDYFLHLDDTKYAVEVTTLMGQVEVGNFKLPEIAVVASLWKLVEKVETTAKENDYLNGAYVVSFSRPIDDFRRIREQIYDGLLAYVQATTDVSAAPEQVVFKQGMQKCTIRKMHDQKSYIGKSGPTASKWEGEAADEICAILEERISSKAHKLRMRTQQKILLLYDAYHFASSQMYNSCLHTVKTLHCFHTIFVVTDNEAGKILFTKNPSWQD